MAYPSFFDQIPTITLRDPLSELLGSAEGGIIEYSYAEIVKLTGHSCPTVAGAWLMTTRALKRLYGDELPTRGDIAVSFRNSAVEGVTGVIASVASFITGATTDTGFKGLGGQFARRNLMHFEQPITGEIRFERLDTGQSAAVSFNASVVPASAEMMPQLFAALQTDATPQQRATLAKTWQGRVEAIFENADQAGLIQFH